MSINRPVYVVASDRPGVSQRRLRLGQERQCRQQATVAAARGRRMISCRRLAARLQLPAQLSSRRPLADRLRWCLTPIGSRTLVETVVPNCALAASDRDRLARLLALVSPTRRWPVEHRHAPLLCALGILDAPDVAYANASRRRFADPSETRERALALIDELNGEIRAERYEQRRSPRPRLWAGVRPH
jgi:hypothetical protein